MCVKPIVTAIAIFSLVPLVSCSTQRAVTQDNPATGLPVLTETKAAVPNTRSSDECDPELWKRVYNPERLEVLDQCRDVTGVIEELDQNEDGDTHMLLKLDVGQELPLSKKNVKKKNGDLVVEVVCANPVTDKKAKAACAGYTNQVTIPKVGDRVKVTGSYVNDSHNEWNEIHPVSRIEVR